MKILILSPHTDDEVLGAGGSIARWIEEGHDVHVYAFSDCQTPGIEDEYFNAIEVLGVENATLVDFRSRVFSSCRQQILERMIELRETLLPDLVLCPSKNDVHQDHQVITQEAMRAFKHCSILGYEMPWNNYAFESDYFVRLEYKHIKKKSEAISIYKSQAHRPYCSNDYMKSLAYVRGIQVGSEYAETFQLIRWIH